jgi:hypothetical protein
MGKELVRERIERSGSKEARVAQFKKCITLRVTRQEEYTNPAWEAYVGKKH